MKKTVIMLLCAFLSVLLVSCNHEHNFIDGICECGETSAAHTSPVTTAHKHSYTNGHCTCGAQDPLYVPAVFSLTFVGAEDSEHKNPTEYTEGATLVLEDAKRRGYTFLGWYNAADERVCEISADTTGDLTLTAKWELTTYTITYENTASADTASYEKTYTMLDDDIPLPVISLDGYTFCGWEINGVPATSIKSGSTGNIVAKAILIPPQYTLFLETPYGTLDKKTVSVGYQESYTLPVLASEGKRFIGWFDNTGEHGVRYTDESGRSLTPYPHSSGRTLYARFDEQSCIVSYDTMGGDLLTSTYINYGAAFDDSVIPTKAGAVFAGWYNADFSSRYTAASIITSATTVYAKWVESTPIFTAEQLIAIKDAPLGNYHLTCDINMNGIVWEPIESFGGTLDGNGHTIKNFAIHPSSYVTPYGFIRTNTGTIQNITFTDFTYNISTANSVGASFGVIVGINNGSIYNCRLEHGMISVTYTLQCPQKGGASVMLGGICGENYGTLIDCKSTVPMSFSVTHTSNYSQWDDHNGSGVFGGIVGQNYGRVSSCSFTGALTYFSHINNPKGLDGTKIGAIGGIVGKNAEKADVSNSFAKITVTASTTNTDGDNNHHLYMGGIAGTNDGNLSDSYATGSIEAKNAYTIHLGGAVGRNTLAGVSANCYAKVALLCPTSGSSVGGFVGYNNATVQSCYATGAVDAVGNTGGFVGFSDTAGTISKCYSTGNVTAKSANSGFFVGKNAGIIYNCYYMRGATLLVNGEYKDHVVEQNTIEGVLYSTLWSKEFLVDKLYWDGEGWIVLANEDPMLEWEVTIDHDYRKTVVEPTCTSLGFTVYSCNDCDRYFIMDVVAEHGHDITRTTRIAPTCTERGYTASYCSRCDDVIATDIQDPLGHTHGALIEHRDPTCTEEGCNVYSCSVCGAYKAITEPIAPLGHTEVIVPATEQTCTQSGRSERIYCGVCKTLIKASKTIEPHFYHIEVTKAATCTEAGECTKYCVVCEHLVEGAPIEPHGHTDLNGDIICDDCGVICGSYRDDQVIEISSADQLASIAQGLNLIYRLTADITLPNGWIPLGTKDKPFTGYLDGNGHKVTLCAFENASVAGLFGYNAGVIVNLTITGITVHASNKDTVFGGIAAYNTGVISNCVASGDAFVTLTVTSIGASEGLKRTVHSGVFGCLVGVNQPSGRILGSTVSCALLAKIDNTAKSTATNSLVGWLTKSFDSIRVESIASLAVGIVAGQNSGTVGACRATGLTNIGERQGIGKPVAIAAYRYGTVTAENHYYCDGITGINSGTVFDSDVPFLVFNVPPETEYNVNSYITYKERTMCCIYTAEV